MQLLISKVAGNSMADSTLVLGARMYCTTRKARPALFTEHLLHNESLSARTRNSGKTHLARETVGIPNTPNAAATYCEKSQLT